MAAYINRSQNDNPVNGSSPPLYNPIIIENIHESDLRDTLRSQKRSGDVFMCPVSEKKELLTLMYKHRKAISTALKRVDEDNSKGTGSLVLLHKNAYN